MLRFKSTFPSILHTFICNVKHITLYIWHLKRQTTSELIYQHIYTFTMELIYQDIYKLWTNTYRDTYTCAVCHKLLPKILNLLLSHWDIYIYNHMYPHLVNVELFINPSAIDIPIYICLSIKTHSKFLNNF